MQHFNVDILLMTQILASYYLSYALGQIPAGLILDRYPLHYVLPLAVLLCIAGLGLFVMTSDPGIAEIGRVIVGLGSAFSLVGVLKITRDYLPQLYFNRVIGLTISLGTLMATYAEVISLRLVKYSDWMGIFTVSIVVGLVLSFIMWLALHKCKKIETLVKTSSNWFSIWNELRSLLTLPRFWLNAVMGGLFYAPTSVLAALYGVYFLVHRYLFTPSESAFCISLLFLGWVIGSPLVGWLCDRFRHELIIIRLSAFLALMSCTAIIVRHHASYEYIESMMFLMGLFSSGQILVWQIFAAITPGQTEGIGAALTNCLIMLVVGAVQVMMGYLLVKFPGHAALSLLPVCFALTILFSFCFSASQIRTVRA